MIELPTYSQADPRWGNESLLPYKSLPMSRWGCFVTSLSMALHAYNIELDPGETVAKLKEVNGIDGGGLLTYDGVERAFEGVHFYGRFYTENDRSRNFQKVRIETAIDKVRKLLDAGQPVILAVDNLFDDDVPDHAVLAYDYRTDGDTVVDLYIHDPDGGKDILFSQKYGEIRDELYGFVALIGPPTMFPDQSEDEENGIVAWKCMELKEACYRQDWGKVRVYSREIIDSLLS